MQQGCGERDRDRDHHAEEVPPSIDPLSDHVFGLSKWTSPGSVESQLLFLLAGAERCFEHCRADVAE
ncbi:MAG: hypothetical protein ABL908_18100, partial [Hyphomicrobium sp.]